MASAIQDLQFMARALQLGARGLYSTHPNPRVGCVLVKNGQVIGEGWHQHAGGPHAEIHALSNAGANAKDATAYVTLEPCSHHGRTPPCADALIGAGIARAVIAMVDPNPQVGGKGLARLKEAGVETTVGVLETEAERLNPGFFRRMRGGLPWIRLKVAASMDGRTAMRSGESQWITGSAARADVQRLRARSSAILTGIGTVRDDDPAMTVRPAELGDVGEATLPIGQPSRIVLDTQLQLYPNARVLKAEGEVVVLCGRHRLAEIQRVTALESAGARVVGLPAGAEGESLAWNSILEWLRTQPYNELLIEAGATVAGSALEARCVDELWLYQAPTLLGSEGRPLARLPFDKMSQQLRLEVLDQRRIGDDIRTIFQPAGGKRLREFAQHQNSN